MIILLLVFDKGLMVVPLCCLGRRIALPAEQKPQLFPFSAV